MGDKHRTMECADLIRKTLKEKDIQARVSCIFYKGGQDLITVTPKGYRIDSLNHWEKSSLDKGLEFYLNIWNDLGKQFAGTTKISVG